MATPRTRERVLTSQYGTHKRYRYGMLTHTHETPVNVSSDTMDDYVVPDFHKRIAEGEVLNNPCTYVKESFRSTGGGLLDIVQNGSSIVFTGDGSLTTFTEWFLQTYGGWAQYGHGYEPAPTPPYDLEDAAKAKALGNVDRSPYSFAEDIAEFHETLRFLRDPFASLKNLSELFEKDLKKLTNAKKTLTRAKAIADVWLQYQFAFSPLVRSASDLIEAQSDKIRRPKRRTARGVETWKDSASSTSDNPHYFWSSHTVVDKSVRAGILYEVDNPFVDWQFKYGLRFKDIPETLWAIAPYSFLVDRVYNLSTALRGLTALLDPSVKMLASWSTSKTTTTEVRSLTDYQHPGVTSKTFIPDTDTKETFLYQRKVWSPSAKDVLPVPRWDQFVNTSTKLADVAALILQKIR